MAAIHPTPSSIPERRRRTPEIINVDELDDDIVPRPRQRRRVHQPSDRDVIVISDGDDDNEPEAGPSQPRTNREFRVRPLGALSEYMTSEGRRMRSPQIIRQPSVVPPVPTLPRHLRGGYLSMPMHRVPPPHPTDIVRPIDRPFTFEATMEPPPRDRTAPPLAPAPASHHVPVMGLGGALLATRNYPLVRTAAGPRHRGPQEPAAAGPRRNNFWSLGNLGLFGRAHDPEHADDDDADARHGAFDDRMLLELLAGEWDDMAMARHSAERPLFMSAHHPGRRVRHFEPEYKSAYTHRGKPEPGFTSDFAPPAADADAGDFAAPPSSSSSSDPSPGDGASTILVCARCLDPLLTSDSATGEEHARRRIWALRCGHMLDGKCVAELMQPAPRPHHSGPGSGGGAMWVEIGSGKGKGKATEPADDEHEHEHDELLLRAAAPEPTMRSRLRPRHGPNNSSPSRLAATPAPSILRVASRAKGKGKGKTKAPQVEQAFEWACPVPGCHHEHRSVLVDGKWGPDEKRGAIAMYV
ncbi:hypothetical protein FIBSPDRAFT_931049 [Athelia psychrophila]|uniref:Uncharacterized protein n=1 Tax=Athelia psychrophila TaxID=1759441 RepID=A0A166L7X0_9AGAM|nr:hypothetical protein FIBSPDRAFT_931049 [Fibularhizoctonia sp. CBS 109695]